MNPLLAAIRSANPAPAPLPAATPAAGALPPELGASPLKEVVALPMPLWEQALLWIVLLVLLAAAVWAVRRWWPRAPVVPPPTPRQLAIRELERLRPEVRTLDPQAFSFAVSAVLRRFVEGQFGVRALERTSPEFLAEIASSSRFSADDRRLLAGFLERADMIKFARVGADESASEALFASAAAFVQGGRA